MSNIVSKPPRTKATTCRDRRDVGEHWGGTSGGQQAGIHARTIVRRRSRRSARAPAINANTAAPTRRGRPRRGPAPSQADREQRQGDREDPSSRLARGTAVSNCPEPAARPARSRLGHRPEHSRASSVRRRPARARPTPASPRSRGARCGRRLRHRRGGSGPEDEVIDGPTRRWPSAGPDPARPERELVRPDSGTTGARGRVPGEPEEARVRQRPEEVARVEGRVAGGLPGATRRAGPDPRRRFVSRKRGSGTG